MFSNDYAQAPSISTNVITNHSETRVTGASESHVQPPSRSELLNHVWSSIISGDSERLMTKTNPAPPDFEGRVNKSEIAYKQGPTQYEVVQPVSRSEVLHHAENSIISEDGERLMTKTNPAPNKSEIANKQGPTQSDVVELEEKNVVKSENNCKNKVVEIDNKQGPAQSEVVDLEEKYKAVEIAYKPGPTQSEVVDLEEKNAVKSENNCKIKVVEIAYKQGPTQYEAVELEEKNKKVVEVDNKQGSTQSETVVNQLNNLSPGGFVVSKFEATEVVDEKSKNNNKSKKIGVLSWIWKAVFGLRGDDIEKRLQYLRKEEGVIVNRMNMRSLTWRRTAMNLIVFSVIIELIAVGYAIVTTRTADMDWRMRSLRVLPMFLIPALSFGLYYGLSSFTNFCDRRDQKTLDKLRDETRAKIDELKERNNYYTTHQLIQKYDPYHAAPVLADELQPEAHVAGKCSDVDFQSQHTSGLRKRKQSDPRSPGSEERPQFGGNEVSGNTPRGQLVVENRNLGASGGQDGGWIARIAALLVGEDPTQLYALICGNCHTHNGLARKEEFPFITYFCSHCHVLNEPKNSDKTSPVSGSIETASANVKLTEENESTGEKVAVISSPMVAAVEEKEANEKTVAA